MAVIDLSRFASYGYDQRVEVFGPKGMIKIENSQPIATETSTNTGINRYVVLCSS